MSWPGGRGCLNMSCLQNYIENVIGVVEFEPANAIKATIKRPVVSGALGETDVYGSQQHAPLLGLEVPVGN